MQLLKFLVAASYLCCFVSPSVSAGAFGDSFREWLLGSEAQASTRAGMEVQLDAVGEACMACHNGTAAGHITVKNAGAPLQVAGTMNVNHPVGMDYNEYAYRKPRSYQPSTALDPNIRLVDGKVGCVSCHQLKENAPQQLAMADLAPERNSNCTASNQLTVGPEESDLCLACHIK